MVIKRPVLEEPAMEGSQILFLQIILAVEKEEL